MNKPDYIKKVEEETKEFFSVVHSDELIETSKLTSWDKNKNLTVAYMDTEFTLGVLKYNSKIYKTSSGFYIYCRTHLGTGWDNMEVSVYHKPENINEVIIFLKQINKK